MYSGHEETLHDVVLAANPRPLYWYRATVDYYAAGDPKIDASIKRPGDFPKLITVSYGRAKLKGPGIYNELAPLVTKPYAVDPPTRAERDLGQAG